MKIAYFIKWDISRESGVLKKVISQLHAFEKLGHQAKLFAVSNTAVPWSGCAQIRTEVITCRGRVSTFIRTKSLVNLVRAWQPDLVYLREQTYCWGMLQMMSLFPSFVEVQTNYNAEHRSLLPMHWYLYHRVNRGRILNKAAGVVCMTHELAENLSPFKKPTVVVSNGVDLSNFNTLKPPINPNPRLVFMAGSQMPWHGFDKIVWLAGRMPQWTFDIIGDISQPGGPCNTPPNISLHGTLGRSVYEKILSRADVAIGTLALHRKEMQEACPLKVREYLAYGIPTIIGYNDTDFPTETPFLLQLSNSEENVRRGITLIHDFIQRWRGHRVDRTSITHLDTMEKEKQRLSFISHILEKN